MVGQNPITTILENQVKNNKIAHSYLFTGSRGTGKTSCAKILAKAINCLAPENGNPCDLCDVCKGIENGSILDITEMDAASNSGVEDIRKLREDAFFLPAVTTYRVYIIDEVHMLSISAFNALLKIMEEPPKHIVFILATTEVHKVLPTIISRCQRFDFKRIDADILAAQIQNICGLENITIDTDAAATLASLADGAMRDALSLLDVCAAHSATITVDTVTHATGIMGADQIFEFAGLIAEGKTNELLVLLDTALKNSLDPSRLCDQLIAHYRNLMLTKTIDQPMHLISYLPAYLPKLQKQCSALSLSQILYTLSVLQDVTVRLSKTAIKKVELEVALVRLSQPQTKFDPDSVLSRLEELEFALRNGVVPALVPMPLQEKKAKAPSPSLSEKSSVEPTLPIAPFEMWKQVLARLSKLNPAVAGMLTASTAYEDGKRILIDIQNPALLEMLKTNDYTKSSIKQAITDTTGKTYAIGPYKATEQEKEKSLDKLEAFIGSLPQSDFIKIME